MSAKEDIDEAAGTANLLFWAGLALFAIAVISGHYWLILISIFLSGFSEEISKKVAVATVLNEVRKTKRRKPKKAKQKKSYDASRIGYA